MTDQIPVIPAHARNHQAHHEIVGFGQNSMELQDIDGGLGTIASATRSGPGAKWVVTVARAPESSIEVDDRAQAIQVMIDHGPHGVAEGTAGYATFVPHAVAQLP